MRLTMHTGMCMPMSMNQIIACRTAVLGISGIVIGSATQHVMMRTRQTPAKNCVNQKRPTCDYIQRELNLSAPPQITSREILDKINELLIWCNPMPHQAEKCIYLCVLLDHVCNHKEVSPETAEALKKYCTRATPRVPPLA